MNSKKTLSNSGFFLVNKPENITSSNLVQKIKHLTKVSKIGHTGTLDRFALGLLILPYGSYTSLSSYFLSANKTYIAQVTIGKFTDSGDKDGQVLKEISQVEAETWLKQNKNQLIKELNHFINIKEQVPPKISALKVKGKRQADLFRENIEFESKPRPISIYSVNILEFSNISFRFEIKVSSGTYIRKLIIDLSTHLQVPMYLESLIRTEIGKINIKDSNTLSDFEQGTYKSFSPLELMDIPSIQVPQEQELQILNGKKIFISKIPEQFFFLNSKQEILAWCKGQKADYHFLKVFSAR
ncbi:MAG: tRNA pseudouridine(55) synthase TruB [Leptospiraceae bacterium]|nr:tRNA pseudouridine(55) synthase TruB [Leptospiraceae bacterium]